MKAKEAVVKVDFQNHPSRRLVWENNVVSQNILFKGTLDHFM